MSFSVNELADGKWQFTDDAGFEFESGDHITPLTLVYETYGELAPNKDNVVVIHHALSTSSHVSSQPKNTTPGWWENMVGPGKPIDSNKYFIICINNLGSCFGSLGPASHNRATDKPYGHKFPSTTITDMVNSQRQLLQALKIKTVHAMIGNSMGAMMSLTWAILYPDEVKHLVSVSSCYKIYPANQANRVLQQDIIALTPGEEGFIVARKHALLTYRNWHQLNKRFADKSGEESIINYLDYNAKKFVRNFDLQAYLTLLAAMDTFNICRYFADEATTFRRLQANVLIVTVDSDVLYTPDQQDDLYQAIKAVSGKVKLIEHHSDYGHDAFLVETDAFGRYISEFIGSTHE